MKSEGQGLGTEEETCIFERSVTMKKNLIKCFSLGITVAAMANMAGSVQAADLPPYCWGTTGGSVFSDMQQLDDKGMLAWVCKSYGAQDHYKVLAKLDSGDTGCSPLYVVYINENQLRFTLRPDLDRDDACAQAVEIIKQYYPALAVDTCSTEADAYMYRIVDPFTPNGTYELQELQTETGSTEIADALMRDLAKAGLISEFYSWGQTARYYTVSKSDSEPGLTYYADPSGIPAFDPDTAAEYLLATGLDWTIEKQDYNYWIKPNGAWSFEEEFALATDLYEICGFQAEYLCPESLTMPVLGTNGLAADGDINLDCSIDIADTVLLARFIAEDKEIRITDTGIGNADLDKDGSVTMSDVSVLLQRLAKLDQ